MEIRMRKKTKKELLAEATEEANEFHGKFESARREAKKASSCAINYARLCGEALIRCKKLKQHGTWKNWVRDNFTRGQLGKSYETAVNYIKIAEEWDSDYIQDGLANGLIRLSQNSILQAIRRKKQQKKCHTEEDLAWMTEEDRKKFKIEIQFKNYLHKRVRQKLVHKLQSLEFELSKVCCEIDGLWILYTDLEGIISYDIWDTFINKLKEVIQEETKKKDFDKNLEDEFRIWYKCEKIEEAQKICPGSIGYNYKGK